MKKENNFYTKRKKDLLKIEEDLRNRGEIVLSFNVKEWEKASQIIDGEMKEFQEDATRKYIGLKLLEELEKKYPRLKQEYNGTKYLPIFTEGNKEEYAKKINYIYNLYNIREIIDVEELPIKKVHIFTAGINNHNFRKVMMDLLSEENSFSVDIYSPYIEEYKTPKNTKKSNL